MAEKRRFFRSEEKVAILQEHLLDRKPVSDICDQYQIHPTMFYRWQKQIFERGSLTLREEDSRKKFLKKRSSSWSNG